MSLAENERQAEILAEDPSLAGAIGSDINSTETSSQQSLNVFKAAKAGVQTAEFTAASGACGLPREEP